MKDELIGLSHWFSMLGSADQQLFAVLDSAREPRIPSELQRRAREFSSLYRGEPEEALAHVAPYLVKINPTSEFMRWLLGNGWGQSWGIFLLSSAKFDDLRRHLRRFLLVRDPSGVELYFRFYDPRVLRIYLPTCTAFETTRFFGPVMTFLTEAEDGEAVSLFSIKVVRTIRLSDLHNNPVEPLTEDDNPPDTGYKSDNRRLRIREEQMKTFSNYMNESFTKRAILHLRQERPDATKSMSDADLKELIDSGVRRAAMHSFTRENEIGVFLELMVQFGMEFDDKVDWANRILRNPEMSSAEKVAALREQADMSAEKGIVAET